MKMHKIFEQKKLFLGIIGILLFTSTSLLILSNDQSDNLESIEAVKIKNNYKLNDMQKSFFDIVNYMEENEDILVEQMRGFNKNLKLEKTEQLGKDNMADIYIIENESIKTNEEIKVYYVKRDGKDPYYARNVEYNIKSKDKNITLLRLAHVNIFKEHKSIAFELATESLNELNNNTKMLNFKSVNTEMYKIYSNLLKEIENKESFTSKDLNKFNTKFVDTGDGIFTLSSKDNEIIVGFNEKNGLLAYVTFYDISSNKYNLQYINSKTKNLEYKQWDVQEYYEEEYNLKRNNTGHIITINNDDTEEAKENFIKFMSEYNDLILNNR